MNNHFIVSWASVSKGRSTIRDCVKSSTCCTPGCVGTGHKALSHHELGIKDVIRASGLQECLQCSQLFPELFLIPCGGSQHPTRIYLSWSLLPNKPCPNITVLCSGVGGWSSRRCPSAYHRIGGVFERGSLRSPPVLHEIKVGDEEIAVCFSSIQFVSHFGGTTLLWAKPKSQVLLEIDMYQVASQDISMKVNCGYKAIDIIGQLMSKMELELLTSFRALGDALILHFLRYLCMGRTQVVKWLYTAVFLLLHNIL